jgi:hypothetical protein
MRNHLRAKCKDADIESATVTVVPLASDHETGKQKGGVTVGNNTLTSSGDMAPCMNATPIAKLDGQQQTVNQPTTNTVSFVPCRSEGEVGAMAEEIDRDPRKGRLVMLNDFEDAPGIMYRYTKGNRGPAHLRNATVGRKYVLEQREDGKVKVPLRSYTSHELCKVLQGIDILVDKERENDTPVGEAAHAMYFELHRVRPTRDKRRLSLLEMAELYRDDNATFHKVVKPEDRQLVMDVARKLHSEITDA